MVEFREFMSIGLDKCGSDRQTFADLVEVWNRQKDEIKSMNKTELRTQLNCP